MEFINNEISNVLKLYNYVKNNNLEKKKSTEYYSKILKIIDKLKINNKNDILLTTEIEIKKKIKNIKNEDVFEYISTNDINKIKNLTHINFREINNEGNTILHHAIKIGDCSILKILFKKGGNINQINGNGNTLLEYACLCKDPNIIHFLILHGCNMQKHLFFRDGNMKQYLNKSDIDLAILLKILLINSKKSNNYNNFSFLEKYFNIEELVGIEYFTIKDLLLGLNSLFHNKNVYHSYKQIIIEELDTFTQNLNKKCSYQKIDLILINLVPFINFPFNLSSDFILKNELKYVIKHSLKQNKNNYKNILINYIFDNYIKTNIVTQDYLGIILYQIISKNKL
jgi:ankyrin repeat protein